MLAVHAVHSEPIPGYRLLEPLGKGGFGEVWKCQAPGGMLKAIKFVTGSDDLDSTSCNAQQELRALDNIKKLRHPFLLSIERIELVEGNLVIVSELADSSLHDLLETHRKAGRQGIPRAEALSYMYEAAEVLDFLNQEHGLQHLDIKPRNLFLVGKHIKVADFGLVASLAEIGSQAEALGGITPLYAAPEIFDGRATLFSDQYSLAVTYTELLTGDTPYNAKNARHLMMLVGTTEPDLRKLPETDRAIVARAMSKDPCKRFPSCLEFVEALGAVSPPAGSGLYRSLTTSIEIPIGGLGATKANTPRPSSELYRRESRVMAAARPTSTPSDQILPGYHLQECLGRGQSGELWRARGPRGTPKFVRIMTPPAVNDRGENPLGLLLNLNHALTPNWEMVPLGADRIALVCDAGESSLATRFKEFRTAGQPGIPRAELTAALRGIAQGLDELYHDTGLQHLILTPKHLGLQNGAMLLMEFGLAELLWLPAGVQPASMSPRYCAAELHEGLISDACDQYSLALIYAELFVGVHPFHNLNARQLASPQLRGQPDLSLLPPADRAILAQALDLDPEKRFRSCAEFVIALEENKPPVELTTRIRRSGMAAVVSSQLTAAVAPAPTPASPPAWRPAFDELVASVARGFEIQTSGILHYRLAHGQSIEHRGWARLAPGMSRLKVTSFREQWQADLLGESSTRWQIHLKTESSLWQRCLGKAPGLLIDVVLGTPQSSNTDLTPVRITIEPMDCTPGKASQVLAEVGPILLTSLQTYLNIQSRRTDQERYPLEQMVGWQPSMGGMGLMGQMRDIGRNGLSIFTTVPVSLGAGTVSLTRLASTVSLQVPGTIRDCIPDGEGRYLVEIALG